MSKNRQTSVLLMCMVVLALTGMVMAQPQRGQGQRGGQRPGGQFGGRGNFDPARMQQMMMDRMKERLGADDTAMKIIGPRLMKVMELRRQSSGFGRMMMFGRGRGGPGAARGGDRGNTPERQLSPTEKIAQELRALTEQDNPNPADLKSKLTALRAAREKDKQALATAQQKLREVLTLKQEVILILDGTLE